MRTESRPMGDRPQRAAGGKFGAKPKRDRGDRPGGSSTGGRFFRKKTCRLCSETANPVDYKDKDRLSRYLTEKGKIIVNDFYETNISGIYAIGDVIDTPALAHMASAEGITCVEKIAGLHVEKIDYNNIPGCTYCSPEIASVGYTEKEAIDAGYKLKIGKFPFSASGKASASGNKDGFVKLIFDDQYGELLGAHMIGNNVTEMIAEIVSARKLETTGHELIKTIHPHPTLSEAVMEAAAAAYGEVIHL